MRIPDALARRVEAALEASFGESGRPAGRFTLPLEDGPAPSCRIQLASPSSGGCINQAARLRFSDGSTGFLKWLDGAPAWFFEREADGLAAMAAATPLRVPRVIAWSDRRVRDQQTGGVAPPFLLMEDLLDAPEGGAARGNSYDEELGRGLAIMHQRGRAELFGYAVDNFIGRTPQENGWFGSWSSFFREKRLEAMLARLEGAGALDGRGRAEFDPLLARTGDLLQTDEPPALVHGDLWGGNVLGDGAGRPALIDPAVYFGNGEVDLAMTELFGGFSKGFREAYHEVHPRVAGYEERREVYNLFHVLNHALLFGGGYLSRALATARRFT